MERECRSQEPQRDNSFDRLSQVLEQIQDSEIQEAMLWVRQRRTGARSTGRPRAWANAVDGLDPHELIWLETVLCVRAQQAGRDAAWRRFAESSYREFVAFYR